MPRRMLFLFASESLLTVRIDMMGLSTSACGVTYFRCTCHFSQLVTVVQREWFGTMFLVPFEFSSVIVV